MANLNWRGTWTNSNTYQVNDICFYEGSSYIAIDINTYVVPSANPQSWGLLVEQGIQGIQGVPGIQGATGTGSAGDTGATGATGDTGQGLTWRNAWSSTITYNAYDCVSYGTKSYICIADTVLNLEPDTNPSQWDVLCVGATGSTGTTGATGSAGPPLTPFGAYAGGTTYAEGSVVTEGGSSYISLVSSNTGNDPASSPTKWMVLAIAAGLTSAQTTAILGVQNATTLPLVRNLFSNSNFTAGLVNTSGALDHTFDGSGYGHVTINVAGLTQIIGNHLLGEPSAGSYPCVAFFDSLGAFISYVGTGSSDAAAAADTAITVPSGAVTATINLLTGNYNPATIMVVPGATLPGSYIAYSYVDTATVAADMAAQTAALAALAATTVSNSSLDSALVYQMTTTQPTVRNLFFDQTLYGGLINHDGTLDHAHDGAGYGHLVFNVTGLTSVISNYLAGSPSASSYSAGAFYDVAGTFISSITSSTVAANTAITVPSGAVQLWVSLNPTADAVNLSLYLMVPGSALPSHYVSSQYLDTGSASIITTNVGTLQTAAQPFAGATVWTTGDSILWGGLFLPSLQAVLNSATISASSGGSGEQMYQAFSEAVATHAANPTGPSVTQLVATSIAGASLLVVEFGTNDGATTLGTSADTASPVGTSTTFYGDCKMVATTLEAAIALNAPAVMPTIVVVTPYLQSRVTGTTLTNLITAEQTVFGGMYGYPVLNWSTQSGINPTNWSVTLSDTVHPTTLGGKMLGSSLARFILANAHQ
jgi:collagen type VII alpha